MAGTRLDGRVERGNRTRQLVLRRTVDIASVEGLEALSVGRLATELQLSKSGVFALFGSKQELQLATVREAGRVYVEQVIRPAAQAPAGIARVRRLCELWLDYSQGRVFPGGCFFYEVVAEFDARPGPVHDAVVRAQRDWTDHVERTVAEARDLGDLHPDTDAPQLAFELIALMETANAISVLRDETVAYRRARVAIASRLRAAATDPSAVPEVS
ncbi:MULTISPECIES: TetR family transcriptional regulator C-terminal domain-containing protein [unclassified Streptomyces]|uniref:TetR/AcrR family transcriptional regulator n=1 Tax=unclassified Streptomyces TaxID=2593676 RepID=UPI002E805065|nr:TetR/AcrR family transcriptional regulator [Streptomyces sp. NBC_00589]WTI35502.1 TetR family transcriptional regulator [Streptomyces sp. NBC_00775]WUB30825.1 TetR family transcriptional regulator [Streptomyces sp. NBC_00589]